MVGAFAVVVVVLRRDRAPKAAVVRMALDVREEGLVEEPNLQGKKRKGKIENKDGEKNCTTSSNKQWCLTGWCTFISCC